MHLSTFGTISHGLSPSALRSAQHFGTGHSSWLLHLYASRLWKESWFFGIYGWLSHHFIGGSRQSLSSYSVINHGADRCQKKSLKERELCEQSGSYSQGYLARKALPWPGCTNRQHMKIIRFARLSNNDGTHLTFNQSNNQWSCKQSGNGSFTFGTITTQLRDATRLIWYWW